MKLRKKRLVILLLMLSLFTTACSNEEVIYYTIEAEDIPDVNKEKEPPILAEEEVEESFKYNDAINDDGLFFEKISLEEEVTFEDIILTNEERGIETDAYYEAALTEELEYYQNSLSTFEQSTLEKLNVRNLAETCYLSSIMTDYIEKHTFSSLYIEEDDDLDWDNLFTTLKENSIEYRMNWLINADHESDEILKELYEQRTIETIHDEDLEIWIEQFHDFIIKTREQFPNLDMRRLACVLEDYAIGYEKETEVNKHTYASTTYMLMIYPLWDGCYPNFENFLNTNYHEFYHLINVACDDEKNDLGYLFCGGISLDSWLKYDDYYANLLNGSHLDCYLPFYYPFIEEANAENYASSLLGSEPDSYKAERFLFDSVEYSLFLQNNYEIDNIRKASIAHNPIALLEQFPIMNMSEREWFYMQLEMLECYAICHNEIKMLYFNYDIFELEDSEDSIQLNERIVLLQNHADLQMMRNFIWSLINCENTERGRLKVEDYDYLLHLMETRINLNREALSEEFGLGPLGRASYLEGRKRIVQIFEEYINTFSKEPYTYHFLETSWDEKILSDAFTEEEKLYIENLLIGCEEYQKESKTVKREDLIKEYYLVP